MLHSIIINYIIYWIYDDIYMYDTVHVNEIVDDNTE